jgi:hypothetical protein
MELFFAGAIRGGRSDVDLYARLVDALGRYGDVLTEHVGTEDVEERERAAGLTDRDIHDQDVAWLRRADVVVAEATTPSLGVGYEVGRAVEWGTPVCCLYRPGGEHELSAMLRGNPAVEVVEYDEPAAAEAAVGAFVERHR